MRKVERRQRRRREEKDNYGRGKAAWKCLWYVFKRENTLNKEEDKRRCIAPEL